MEAVSIRKDLGGPKTGSTSGQRRGEPGKTVTGRGVTYGYALPGGLLVSLDCIENALSGRRLSRETHEDLGVSSTYLSVEYESRQLPAGTGLNLSDGRWRFGLVMEF